MLSPTATTCRKCTTLQSKTFPTRWASSSGKYVFCSGLTLTETKVRASFTRVLYINPRPGQYLTHAHSRITKVVAAMKSCSPLLELTRWPFPAKASKKHSFECQLNTTRMGAVGGKLHAVLPRHALGRRISIFADLCASKSNKTNWPGGGLVYVCQLLLSLSCLSLNICSIVQEDLLHTTAPS